MAAVGQGSFQVLESAIGFREGQVQDPSAEVQVQVQKGEGRENTTDVVGRRVLSFLVSSCRSV